MGQKSSCEATRRTVSILRPRSKTRRNSLTRATDSPSSPQSANREMASASDSSSDSSVVEIGYQDLNACKDHVLLVFPDISPTYLEDIAVEHQYQSDAIISAILDRQEEGNPYPTQPRENPLKRKHPCSDDEQDDDQEEQEDNPEVAVRKIRETVGDHGESGIHSAGYIHMATTLLSQDFPKAKLETIKQYITSRNTSLFEAYIAMDKAVRNWNDEAPPWTEKKRPTKKLELFNPDNLPTLDLSGYPHAHKVALVEMRAAREFRAIKDAEAATEAEEQTNFARAQEDGQTAECGICYDEYALNRMVQCQGETMHWFCRGCMRSQAESQVGMSKYELTCMSVDGCTAGFSRAQRALFLDKKLSTALDRIEQEAMLRMAGIENLETCPFCPYAAEYPPVEVDKEFRCDNPKCGQVSCRLCRRETHIPKTCAEAAADRGVDARHILEEAMSAALIRRCNKCQNPFVKQDGCNKVVCTKCRTIMCDVCRQTVKDYSHFDDTRRGGKQGQCPLFDKSDIRYDDEVREAEIKARRKVVEDNPQVVRDLSTLFRF
ncbi:hypothetical protein F5X99DRAFT_417918 [Biscogniauxia marginata]|nr:hypothetical protein F5X99DRAFT_417918 [Biscogniauxia marginata]